MIMKRIIPIQMPMFLGSVPDGHNPSRRQDQLLGDIVIFPAHRLEFWKDIGAAGVGFVHFPLYSDLSIPEKHKFRRTTLKNDSDLQGRLESST
jgi:hypothetical protein